MSQGKAPPNIFLEADEDLLSYREIIEAYGAGATIDSDAPMAMMSAIAFGRVVEAAIYMNKSILPNGQVHAYQARAQQFMFNCVIEEGMLAGSKCTIEELYREGLLSLEVAIQKQELFNHKKMEISRAAARGCAVFLGEIADFRSRRGRPGRPKAAKADGLGKLWDTQILRDACASVAPGLQNDRNEIATKIREVVRCYVKFGQLTKLGETELDCIDRHTRRVTRLLDSLPQIQRSWRGFSIKRLK